MSKNAAGVEVFKGFDIKYPEYSVITPHTLQEFTIRSLTVQEEEVLKASLLTPNTLSEHLNKVIFSCLVKKPDNIKTLDDFINNLTIKDRDALMYGLYHVTYKDIHSYDVTCTECDTTNSVKIDFLKSFKTEMWPSNKPEDSILKKEIPIKFEIASNITAIIVQPKLVDEQKVLKSSTFVSEETRDLSLELLVIKRFEIDRPEAKTPDTLEDRDNIVKGYKQLPVVDKSLINKTYQENFGKYGVSIKTIVKCKKCGFENNVSIDLVRQFFRSVYI